VGLSHFPLTAPAVNVRVQFPLHIYVKGGLQRSLDARGGSATIARNLTGFRFAPHGDGLVSIVETGYRTPPRKDSYGTWFRAGAIHNTTRYESLSGGSSTGNYCAFLLADRQIVRTDSAQPERGLFAGVSAIIAPSHVNAYAKYFEMRVYDEAPFARRPRDMASIVASRNSYSGAMVQKVMAQGGTVWHNSTSLTESYNAHLHNGLFAGFGVSYVTGPAITPHVPNALTTNLQLNLFW
jgi:carbohydrate-selective porin OprB